MKKIPTLISILIFITEYSFAQGGENCATAFASPITVLPFTATGQTTCGKVDNYNAITPNMNIPTCISTFGTQGPDWLYYFVAPTSGPVLIQLSNFATNFGMFPMPTISVWNAGCPNVGGSNCVEGMQSFAFNQMMMMTFPAIASQGYYIMIDIAPLYYANPPYPVTPPGVWIDCFDYDISIDYVAPPIAQPSCTNIDFEQGTLNGWYGTSGRTTISCGATGSPRPDYDFGIPGFTNGQHAIMSGAGVDICGGFPVVCPAGGNYSVKLGDDIGVTINPQNAENGSATLQQTFNITGSNAYITYWYAVVVQYAASPQIHLPSEQPFFQIEVLDCNGNPLPCGQYLVVGGPNLPGFNLSANCIGITYYKNWTPVALDLSSQIGSCVTLRFTVGDCCLGAHYTYAYIDLEQCKPVSILANDSICVGQSTTLTAPPGFSGYSWSNGANTSAITVSPIVQTTYSATLTSVSGPGCVTVLKDTVFVYPTPDIVLTPTNVLCNTGNNGSITAVVNAGSSPYTYSWSTIPVQTTTTATGLTAGAYTLNVTDARGCTSIQSITITEPSLLTATATATNSICNGSNNGSAIVTGGGGTAPYTYSWSSGAGSAATASGLTAGNHTVTLTDALGCTKTATVTVVTTSSVTATITGTNASCGGLGTATVTTNNGTAPFTYQWSANANNQITQTITGLAAGTYSVTITDANGCTAALAQTITGGGIVPTAFFPPSASCLGVITTLADGSIASPSDPLVAWNWIMPGGSPASSVSQNTSTIYSAAGTYTVTLVVTTQWGCKDTIPQQVLVYTPPVADFSGSAQGCAPLCTSQFLDSSTSTDGSITSWQWSFPGGTPGSSATQNPGTICYAAPGVYGATLIVTTEAPYGCKDTITITPLIDVHPWPKADFCVSPLQAPITNPVFAFCDLWSPNPGVTNWVWDYGDNSPKDSGNSANNLNTDPIHSYAASVLNNDFYKFNVCVIVQNQYGCLDTLCKMIELVPDFTFYIPNTFTPNEDETNELFFGKGRGIKEYNIWIFDRWGNQIWDCHHADKNTNWDSDSIPKQDGLSSFCKWDGKVVAGGMDMSGNSRQPTQEDVYVWKVRLTDSFDKTHNYIGHVSVVR